MGAALPALLSVRRERTRQPAGGVDAAATKFDLASALDGNNIVSETWSNVMRRAYSSRRLAFVNQASSAGPRGVSKNKIGRSIIRKVGARRGVRAGLVVGSGLVIHDHTSHIQTWLPPFVLWCRSCRVKSMRGLESMP